MAVVTVEWPLNSGRMVVVMHRGGGGCAWCKQICDGSAEVVGSVVVVLR